MQNMREETDKSLWEIHGHKIDDFRRMSLPELEAYKAKSLTIWDEFSRRFLRSRQEPFSGFQYEILLVDLVIEEKKETG